MPEPAWIGLGLLWLGVVLLLVVVFARHRAGAWSEEAFEEPPPLGPGLKLLALLGGLISLVGGGLSIAVLL